VRRGSGLGTALSAALHCLRWIAELLNCRMRQTDQSKISLYEEGETTQKSADPISTIFEIAKNLAIQLGEGQVSLCFCLWL